MFEFTNPAIDNVDLDLTSPSTGPKPTTSLLKRRSPLADPIQQQADLAAVDLTHTPHQGDFAATLADHAWKTLSPARLEIFQINVGKLFL